MSTDPSIRPILPHQASRDLSEAQMNYQFAYQQPAQQQRENQKNYVFVDEHNRHKRLKVMRACEGCRRRKIKCDAATTNTWPCSACVRLKLSCVRPNGFDGLTDATIYDPPMSDAQYQQLSMQQSPESIGQSYAAMFPDGTTSPYSQTVPYGVSQAPQNMPYPVVAAPQTIASHYSPQSAYQSSTMQAPSSHDMPSPEAASPASSSQQQELTELLGNLKVDETGTALYLRNKAGTRREEGPAFEEDEEDNLPPLPAAVGMKSRIPPALMPDEDRCMHYFELFFTHIHPYVPVLDRYTFYQQWNGNRASISPLILEALFALGGRLAEDPAQGQQWLAMATRHADAFMGTPRLSTLQALLLILKAREASPKRGYYYRSWMTVVQAVQMAKELGLDEHFEDHQVGRPCHSTPAECQLRTRIWQTIFVCEIMVGTPQGRHDLSVDLDSVNFHLPSPIPGHSELEYATSRNFTYFARCVRNISKLSHAYALLKKQRRKEWGLDPKVQQLNQDFSHFLRDLPSNLGVDFPRDGSPPWLQSAFAGNLNSYYHLTVILLHRPQLNFLDSNSPDGLWLSHMITAYDSAKALCRLQEALVTQYGLTGLQAMQRGFSFTVYAGLSCIVLHLVAITSPDPKLNTDARQFFTRHMRIMEKVMDIWDMPELQKQIDAVREAFSADVRKPFVLKPSFPYSSPRLQNSVSPPQVSATYNPAMGRLPLDTRLDTQRAQQVSYTSHPMTPPVSAGPVDTKNDSPSMQPLMMMPQENHGPGLQANMPLSDPQGGWNPQRIFEQWNSTFGTPVQSETSTASHDSPLNISSSSGAPEVSPAQDIAAVNATLPAGAQIMASQQYSAPMPHFVTPAMWQESVAQVYEAGHKRGWDDRQR